MDICELEKTDVILGIPWLVAHNPEIDWEKGEVRMTRCPLLCEKAVKIKEKKEIRENERRLLDGQWTKKKRERDESRS